MKKHFTIKPVLIALLAMISCTMKAEIVEYTTDDGFAYSLNSETQEASLGKYRGEATEVVIPKSVTYDGKEYKVTSLGSYCFSDCSSLTSIEIPSSVTSLGDGCFRYCSSLTSVVIPSSVASLGNSCFSCCSSLTSIEIPSSVASLGDGCFSGCSSLASVVIPSSVTSLGDSCFSGCSSLTSIDLPSSVTSLGGDCFQFCSSLTSIELPSSLTSLASYCFYHCSSLTSIKIPSSVTNIGRGSFMGCFSLESIVVDANNPVYDSREDCNAIIETESNTMIAGCKNTRIPNSVTSLDDYCFSGCSSLTSMKIPTSVTSLGSGCFQNCSSLASILIPSSVTWLGLDCFSGCSSLTTVICKMENVIEDDYLFRQIPIKSATLYVSGGMLDTYKSTAPWSGFGTILPWTEELEVCIDETPELGIALNTNNGNVVVSGLASGTPVSCYICKASADSGTATLTAEPNSIVIVKAGKKIFKVYVK